MAAATSQREHAAQTTFVQPHPFVAHAAAVRATVNALNAHGVPNVMDVESVNQRLAGYTAGVAQVGNPGA